MVRMINDSPYKNGQREIIFVYDNNNGNDVELINKLCKLCLTDQPRCENCKNFYREGCLGNYQAYSCKIYGILESLDNPHYDMDGSKCNDYGRIMYQVFDNGKPADCLHCKVHESWNKSAYDTFEEALEYANKWLGMYGGVVLKLNTPWDYSGYGDMIEIREVDT